MDEYRDVGAAGIFESEERGFSCVNADDPEVMRLYGSKILAFRRVAEETSFKIQDCLMYISSAGQKEVKVYPKDGSVCSGITDSQLIRADEIRIKGVHNLRMPWLLLPWLLQNVLMQLKLLKEFLGLEHRLEFARP